MLTKNDKHWSTVELPNLKLQSTSLLKKWTTLSLSVGFDTNNNKYNPGSLTGVGRYVITTPGSKNPKVFIVHFRFFWNCLMLAIASSDSSDNNLGSIKTYTSSITLTGLPRHSNSHRYPKVLKWMKGQKCLRTCMTPRWHLRLWPSMTTCRIDRLG